MEAAPNLPSPERAKTLPALACERFEALRVDYAESALGTASDTDYLVSIVDNARGCCADLVVQWEPHTASVVAPDDVEPALRAFLESDAHVSARCAHLYERFWWCDGP